MFARLRLESLEDRIALDATSAGYDGINARNLQTPDGVVLTGSNIGIGQVEDRRPGKPGFDNLANSHPSVRPTAVYRQMGPALANQNVVVDNSFHGLTVASVMIADDLNLVHRGVSPNAKLFASAYVATGQGTQPITAETAQHVALQNGGDVRAINFSFGKVLEEGVSLNGNSLLTKFIDWSAGQHETLYLVAGSRGARMDPVPTDEYNALTISATKKDQSGVYRRVDSEINTAEAADGSRYFVDLVAPGIDIFVAEAGGGAFAEYVGTSLATPHATSSVALLQQYAENRIAANADGWDAKARSHLVMKSVMMNSADKIQDVGGAVGYLGMENTIRKKDGTTWLDSDARDTTLIDNPNGKDIPTDLELGTGQLNVHRAVKQYSSGHIAAGTVPAVGWHSGTHNGSRSGTFDSINGAGSMTPEYGLGTFDLLTLADVPPEEESPDEDESDEREVRPERAASVRDEPPVLRQDSDWPWQTTDLAALAIAFEQSRPLEPTLDLIFAEGGETLSSPQDAPLSLEALCLLPIELPLAILRALASVVA